MENYLLDYKSSRINYYRFGEGPRLAFCFHGYGEDGATFGFVEKFAGHLVTFYSIDLPYHGRTEWNEGLVMSPADLNQLIEEITRLHQLQFGNSPDPTIHSKLILIGFSLGGRVALNLYQTRPQSIERIVLLAPDGLKINFWYWLATQSWAGNRFFRFTMKYPGWFFGFLKMLNKAGLVNASIFKFVNYYIGNKEVRYLLYVRWTCLRKLKPDLKRIKSMIKKYRTPVRLAYGRHDRIILPSVGEKFRQSIEEECSITVIDSGHQVLQEKHAAQILSLLND